MTIDELQSIAEQAFAHAKAENVCVGYNSFVLPPGCTPTTCKLAFDWRGDTYLLLIERVRYTGSHAALRNFLQSGEHAESTAEGMQRFIQSLKEAYSASRLTGIVDTSQVVVQPFAMRLDKAALLADLQAEIIGQSKALEGLVNVISTNIRKRKPKRPAAVLFAGPTGTGKTATAEQLARLLTKHTGQDYGYLRVDMNQLDSQWSVSRLIGASPGYIGYDEELFFTPLLDNPRHVLLFDEMEKGHPKVMDVLMNAMASGRMEASKKVGDTRVFDFRSTIMIFTSNLPLTVKAPDSMEQEDITDACRKQLTRAIDGAPMMKTEICARFSEILLYKELCEQDKVDIVALSMLRNADMYDLVIRHIDTGLLQSVVDKLDVSNGVRKVEYALDRLLGEALADFADSHGTPDVAISGDTQSIQVDPCIQ